MRWKPLLLCLLFLPFFGYGQFNSSFDILGGLDYSYRSLYTESDEEIYQKIIDNRNEIESPKLNWRAGFNFNKRLTSKSFLKTGLRFSSEGYKSNITEFVWGSELDENGMIVIDTTLIREARFRYNYYFIEVPLAFRWEITDYKTAPFLEIGINPTMYINRSIKEIVEGNTEFVYDQQDYGKYHGFHFVGYLSFGVNHSFNDKVQLFAQPIFRYHFTKVTRDPIKEFMYNGGIEIGIRRRLNKVEADID